ncbi:MAG: oxidase [Thermoleophilia bacterium]|nr:oxidase [Thermoleophilia bacterium]
MNDTSVIFEPLRLRNLTVKNRILRSSISGLFDNYDGSGTEIRIAWDVRFARLGAGAIISSNAPVHARGRLAPGYAQIDSDGRIPFWRELGKRVHEHDCRYILQLAFAGRNRDLGGFEWEKGLSSTSKRDPVHGFPSERMSTAQIGELVQQFAAGARRAREADLDGIELAGGNGVVFTQFLSSAVNDRKDEYGGSLENRARFALEVVRAIRAEIGDDFYLGFKISVTERLDEILPWLPKGNTPEESIQVCRWLEEAGVDAIHVTGGGAFPHPRNTPGTIPVKDLVRTYDRMLSSSPGSRRPLLNYLMFQVWPFDRFFASRWSRLSRGGEAAEGINLPDARAVKQAVSIPVICTGGFQTASLIAEAIERGDCDAVAIARGFVANPDLVRLFEQGHDRPPRPCTHCNKCLVNFIENPLGCYEESRFDSREEMIRQVMSIFEEPAFVERGRPGAG